MNKDASLVAHHGIQSGKGFFWCLTPKGIQRQEVRRLRVTTAGNNGCVFVENRCFSKLADYGLHAAVVAMEHETASYKFGICLACDLDSCSYLEWDGPLHQLDSLYADKGQCRWREMRKHLTLKTCDLRQPQKKGCIYFVNLVHHPPSWVHSKEKIYLDCRDPVDDTVSYSRYGADIILKGIVPSRLVRKGRASLSTFHIVRPPRMPPGGWANSGRGNFLLVFEGELEKLDVTLKGGPTVGGAPLAKQQFWECPYIGQQGRYQKMALLTREDSIRWIVDSEGKSVEDYNRDLAMISRKDVTYSTLDFRRTDPTWIISVPGESRDVGRRIPCQEFLNMMGGAQSLLVGASFLDVQRELSNCHVLAAGGSYLGGTFPLVSPELLDALVSCYGQKGSFGDRKCSHSMGTNTYQGARCTTATRENPVCGSHNLDCTDYYTSRYGHHHAIVALNPMMATLGNLVMTVGRKLHPLHFSFLESAIPRREQTILRSVCRNRILTTGLMGKILSFANTHHVDKGDSFTNSIQEMYRTVLSSSNGHPYLSSWQQRFGGFDTPTTCGYADVGSLREGDEVFQYFSMGGLNLTARLGPGTVHSFFASRFCHNTAMAVLVRDGKVYLKDERYACFAWGASKA